MYFITTPIFLQLREAGLQVSEESYGIHVLNGDQGVIVNPDALSLEAINACVPAVQTDRPDVARFTLQNTPEGFWRVVALNHEAARHADSSDDRLAESREADVPEEPAQPTTGFMPLREDPRELGRPHSWPLAQTLLNAVRYYETRLDRPVRLVEATAPQFCGMPEVPDDGGLVIAIQAVPGAGPVTAWRNRSVDIFDPFVQRIHAVHAPQPDLPEGFLPLKVNGITMGAYDAHRLLLFTRCRPTAVYAVPAFLEMFAHAPDLQSDDEQIATALAEQALRPDQRDDSRSNDLRRTISEAQAEYERKRARRIGLETAIQNMQPGLTEARLTQQIDALREGGIWRVEPAAQDVFFQLRQDTVTDPRGGPARHLPGGLRLSLDAMFRGTGAFERHPEANRHRRPHPRLMGCGFLVPEVDEAFQESVRAGDIEGALALAYEVLTNFSADDPDVAALDAWMAVPEAPNAGAPNADAPNADAPNADVPNARAA